MLSGMTAAVLVVAMAGAGPVVAADPGPASGNVAIDMRAAMTDAARASALAAPAPAPTLPREALQAAPTRPKRSVTRIVIGAVLGGAVGYLGGALIGYGIESKVTHGACYDVCFRGLIIGASVGTVTGAVLGGRFF
ncbi:MAG: hypothetical protein KAY59_00345 [Acidobacteria bacterium]|nr:hypothetical protein [Acidobacteriota bacterium]MBP8272843.1 hypothetical protein [Acidobacteriota bacterium]